MSEEQSNANAFDVETVRQLVEMMSEHDLSEIRLKQGKSQMLLRRGAQMVSAPVQTMAVPQPAATVASPGETKGEAAPAAPEKEYYLIKSPAPGTYYAQEKPGADPFVKVGSRVSLDTQVGVLEAMKVYSPIEAGCSGVIVSIEVENSQPVEHGTVLMKVDTTQ